MTNHQLDQLKKFIRAHQAKLGSKKPNASRASSSLREVREKMETLCKEINRHDKLAFPVLPKNDDDLGPDPALMTSRQLRHYEMSKGLEVYRLALKKIIIAYERIVVETN